MYAPMQGASAQVTRKRERVQYTMETVLVINKATQRKTYYKLVCGVLRRIGADDHHKIVVESYSASCMSTVGAANPKSAYIRHFTTWHFYM